MLSAIKASAAYQGKACSADALRHLGYQGHHIIPQALFDQEKDPSSISKPADREAFTNARQFLLDSGFNKDGMENMMYLHSGMKGMVRHDDRPIHRGGHLKDYTKRFANKLSDLFEEDKRQKWPKSKKIAAIRDITSEARKQLKDGELIINNAIDKSLKAGNNLDDPAKGVELQLCILEALAIKPQLRVCVNAEDPKPVRIRPRDMERIVHEIDSWVRTGGMPKIDLSADSDPEEFMRPTIHDSLIAEAFLRVDYFMKVASVGLSLHLPYDLISDKTVDEARAVLYRVRKGSMSQKEGEKRLREIGFVEWGADIDSVHKGLIDRDRRLVALEAYKKHGLEKASYTLYGRVDHVTQLVHLPDLDVQTSVLLRNFFTFNDKKTYLEYLSDKHRFLEKFRSYIKHHPETKYWFSIIEATAALTPVIQSVYIRGFELDLAPKYFPPIHTPRVLPPAVRLNKSLYLRPVGGVQMRPKTIPVESVGCPRLCPLNPPPFKAENSVTFRVKFGRHVSIDDMYQYYYSANVHSEGEDVFQAITRWAHENVAGSEHTVLTSESRRVYSRDEFIELLTNPMKEAFLNDDVYAVTSLLKKRVRLSDVVRNEGESLIMFAVGNRLLNILTYLVETCHVDPNELDSNGSSALHRAAEIQWLEGVEYLVSRKDINLRNESSGKTPLAMNSSGYGDHVDIARVLLRHGADVELCDKSGKTAVIYAAESGKPNLLSKLLRYSRNVNHKDKEGLSSAHHAAIGGHVDCLRVLKRFGADFSVLDNNMRTALDLARQYRSDAFTFDPSTYDACISLLMSA